MERASLLNWARSFIALDYPKRYVTTRQYKLFDTVSFSRVYVPRELTVGNIDDVKKWFLRSIP